MEYAAGKLQVRGALRDELAAPIPATTVAVTLRAPTGELIEQRDVTTGPAGRFVVEREAPRDQVVLQAAYAGDGLYRGVRVERRIDQARADVRLELQLPDGPRIDLDQSDLQVRVLAESDSGGNALPMTLQDETGRVLARGETSALGRLTWQLSTDALGGPGSGQLRLESPGDATRGEAQTEARVVRFRRAHVDLTLPDEPTEAGSVARVRGRLYTAAGPRASQPVGIFLDGEHATTAVTRADGSFEAELWPAQPGRIEVVARAERDPGGAYTEASRARTLRVAQPRALPWRWLLLALAPGLWLSLARLKQRRDAAPEATRRPRLPEAGVQIAPRQHKRPTEVGLGGRVVHARTRHPLGGARVTGREADRVRFDIRADAEGRFEVPDCQGTVQVTVQAPGHAALTTRVVIPHRGEWSSCEIRLDSLRDQAMRAYRRLAVPRLPSALTFNLWTPREIASSLKPGLGDRIDALCDSVERAAFAPTPPEPSDIDRIDTDARALASPTAPRQEPHERPRPPSPR